MNKTPTITLEQYRTYCKTGVLPNAPGEEKPKKSKYNAKRTPYNGRVYDSKKEAEHAALLDTLVLGNQIVKWFPQVRFPLPGHCVYVADFLIIHKDGTWTVEDTKGVKTDVYKLKAKLFLDTYGQAIREV